VHGKGVFALQDIAEGEVIIEYVGDHQLEGGAARHPHDPADPNHTFYFHIDENRVIDAKYGGNSSRWINHSCDGNCELRGRRGQDGRVFIKALRNIRAGEELNYDYGLIIDERYTPRSSRPSTRAGAAPRPAAAPCWHPRRVVTWHRRTRDPVACRTTIGAGHTAV
jgi:SET domain-containing protein